MNTSSIGFNAGTWLAVICICAGVTYAGGYFVAMDQAMIALKQKEADWESKSKASKERESSLSGELGRLKLTFLDRERELSEAQTKIESLKRELSQTQTALQTTRQPLLDKISKLELSLTWESAALREAQLILAKKRLIPMEGVELQSPLTLKQVITAKQAFNDIQHEVAAGNFKGLNLTVGYQRLRAIFDNPDLDQLIGLHDAARGQSQ
ncbi:hypothetical protein [Roseimicrobium gellanilyticum]|nr:hypothetical protein [Roseimicrobium gellanilyticum]